MKVLGSYNDRSSSRSVLSREQEETPTKSNNDRKNPKNCISEKVTKKIDDKGSKCSYPTWHNIVAGAAAGAGARFFTAPLDLIKIRQQLVQPSSASRNFASSFTPLGLFNSFRDIVRNEGGLSSLFRGNLAATVSATKNISSKSVSFRLFFVCFFLSSLFDVLCL
jgi:hypothetical protein